MKTRSIEGERRDKVVDVLSRTVWFKTLAPEELQSLLGFATLVSLDDGETIVGQGEPQDSFYLLLKGVVAIRSEARGETKELGRVRAPFSFGEVAVLLDKPQTESIAAAGAVTVLRFESQVLTRMIEAVPEFGLHLARTLALRLTQVSQRVHLPKAYRSGRPADEVLKLLPASFMERHRVLPLRLEDNILTVGFVDPPSGSAMAGLRQYMMGVEVESVSIDSRQLDEVLRSLAGIEDWGAAEKGEASAVEAAAAAPSPSPSPKLDRLLERMVAEGASDLHLAAGRKPRWRIDGDLFEIEDAGRLGATEAYELLTPVMDERHREDFETGDDTDLAYSVAGAGRFRINLYRTSRGVNAAVRQVAMRVLGLTQLGLPKVLGKLCDEMTGLVLVTGPTGSGKSTTVAAMVERINRTQPCHILTIEDPIELVHEDQLAMVHQREVGTHARSFARALRAGLREDPDVVVVGEVRDAETMSLVMEVATSGHLVFATLHTASVVLTIQLIVEMFPGNEQDQARATLAEALRGIVSQTLLKRRGGGRVPAVEMLLVNPAIAHLIREGKTAQLPSAMHTSRVDGSLMLNEELARLVREGKVERREATAKAMDKRDLAKRLGKGDAE